MTTTSYTSSPWAVYNELDKIGLYLGLTRLKNEKNAAYKQRLLDVFVHRSNASYMGLIYGITRELGLSITDTIECIPKAPIVEPAIIFQETKCYIWNDVTDKVNGLVATIDRFDATGVYFLGDLIGSINATNIFTATAMPGVNLNSRAMTIFNQTSLVSVPSEDISGPSGINVKLKNSNLVSDSITVQSDNLSARVDTPEDIIYGYQYYVDPVNGSLITGSIPEPGSSIRYKYRNDNFIVQSSPVIIHNLQSIDFQTKMFIQTSSEGVSSSSSPTPLGASLINELMSVYPMFAGK